MKGPLVILLIILNLNCFSQNCDTINDKTMNCIDNNGNKQGYWIERKKVKEISSFSGYGSSAGCQYKENYKYLTLAEGAYKNNKKIGTWKYYNDNEHSIEVEQEITYYENGALREEDFYANSSLEFNSDTSVITGQLYLHGEKILINCDNKNCVFQYNGNEEIIKFEFKDYEKFDYEFGRLKLGVYNRKINQLKTDKLGR